MFVLSAITQQISKSRENATARSKQEMATPSKIRKTNKKSASSSPSLIKKKKAVSNEAKKTCFAIDRDISVSIFEEKALFFMDVISFRELLNFSDLGLK